MVRELFKLAEESQKQQQKPTGQGRLQQWYFFSVAACWMYFRWVLRALGSQALACHPRREAVATRTSAGLTMPVGLVSVVRGMHAALL